MSYTSRFTSNRFAALDEESSAVAVPPAAAAAVATPATRVWLPSTVENNSANRGGSIFRRSGANDAPVHSAFQGMRGGSGSSGSSGSGSAAAASTSGGFQQVAPRSNGYKSIFAKPESAPAPKTYEDEFPSLGGRSKPKATTAPLPKKTGFADLAKSWAKSAEEEAAAAAECEKEARREQAERDRNDALYERLVIHRRAYIPTEPEYDYNEEAAYAYGRRNSLDDDPYRGAGRVSPYSPPHSPHTMHDYAENVEEDTRDTW